MTLPTGRPKGGYRPGAGRKLSPLKSIKLTQELLERGKKILGDDAAPTPLDWALQLMWNKDLPLEVRLDAMKTAIPYTSPRLSSVQTSNDDDNRLVIEFVDFTNKTGVIVSQQTSSLPPVVAGLISEQDEND